VCPGSVCNSTSRIPLLANNSCKVCNAAMHRLSRSFANPATVFRNNPTDPVGDSDEMSKLSDELEADVEVVEAEEVSKAVSNISI